jgi:hypothetical protein
MNTGIVMWALAGMTVDYAVRMTQYTGTPGELRIKRVLSGLALMGVAYYVAGKQSAVAVGAGVLGAEVLFEINKRPNDP